MASCSYIVEITDATIMAANEIRVSGIILAYVIAKMALFQTKLPQATILPILAKHLYCIYAQRTCSYCELWGVFIYHLLYYLYQRYITNVIVCIFQYLEDSPVRLFSLHVAVMRK